jgi:hypothetical protein
MLATEEAASPTPAPEPRPSLLETHAQNERMRHVPSIPWIVQKLDVDLRRRVERLWHPYADLHASDPRHPALEAEFRALCRAFDRVSHVARPHRPHAHPPNDLGGRVTWSLGQAISALNAADADLYGRRFPFQTFERSNAEPLWAAVLSVIQRIQNLVPLVRAIEPDIDEQLYEGLVQLAEPLRRDPIA